MTKEKPNVGASLSPTTRAGSDGSMSKARRKSPIRAMARKLSMSNKKKNDDSSADISTSEHQTVIGARVIMPIDDPSLQSNAVFPDAEVLTRTQSQSSSPTAPANVMSRTSSIVSTKSALNDLPSDGVATLTSTSVELVLCMRKNCGKDVAAYSHSLLSRVRSAGVNAMMVQAEDDIMDLNQIPPAHAMVLAQARLVLIVVTNDWLAHPLGFRAYHDAAIVAATVVPVVVTGSASDNRAELVTGPSTALLSDLRRAHSCVFIDLLLDTTTDAESLASEIAQFMIKVRIETMAQAEEQKRDAMTAVNSCGENEATRMGRDGSRSASTGPQKSLQRGTSEKLHFVPSRLGSPSTITVAVLLTMSHTDLATFGAAASPGGQLRNLKDCNLLDLLVVFETSRFHLERCSAVLAAVADIVANDRTAASAFVSTGWLALVRHAWGRNPAKLVQSAVQQVELACTGVPDTEQQEIGESGQTTAAAAVAVTGPAALGTPPKFSGLAMLTKVRNIITAAIVGAEADLVAAAALDFGGVSSKGANSTASTATKAADVTVSLGCAACMIRHLTWNADRLRIQAAELGLCESLVELLPAAPTLDRPEASRVGVQGTKLDETFVASVCLALANLSVAAVNKARIVDAGGLSRIATLVDPERWPLLVVSAACACLSVLESGVVDGGVGRTHKRSQKAQVSAISPSEKVVPVMGQATPRLRNAGHFVVEELRRASKTHEGPNLETFVEQLSKTLFTPATSMYAFDVIALMATQNVDELILGLSTSEAIQSILDIVFYCRRAKPLTYGSAVLCLKAVTALHRILAAERPNMRRRSPGLPHTHVLDLDGAAPLVGLISCYGFRTAVTHWLQGRACAALATVANLGGEAVADYLGYDCHAVQACLEAIRTEVFAVQAMVDIGAGANSFVLTGHSLDAVKQMLRLLLALCSKAERCCLILARCKGIQLISQLLHKLYSSDFLEQVLDTLEGSTLCDADGTFIGWTSRDVNNLRSFAVERQQLDQRRERDTSSSSGGRMSPQRGGDAAASMPRTRANPISTTTEAVQRPVAHATPLRALAISRRMTERVATTENMSAIDDMLSRLPAAGGGSGSGGGSEGRRLRRAGSMRKPSSGSLDPPLVQLASARPLTGASHISSLNTAPFSSSSNLMAILSDGPLGSAAAATASSDSTPNVSQKLRSTTTTSSAAPHTPPALVESTSISEQSAALARTAATNDQKQSEQEHEAKRQPGPIPLERRSSSRVMVDNGNSNEKDDGDSDEELNHGSQALGGSRLDTASNLVRVEPIVALQPSQAVISFDDLIRTTNTPQSQRGSLRRDPFALVGTHGDGASTEAFESEDTKGKPFDEELLARVGEMEDMVNAMYRMARQMAEELKSEIEMNDVSKHQASDGVGGSQPDKEKGLSRREIQRAGNQRSIEGGTANAAPMNSTRKPRTIDNGLSPSVMRRLTELQGLVSSGRADMRLSEKKLEEQDATVDDIQRRMAALAVSIQETARVDIVSSRASGVGFDIFDLRDGDGSDIDANGAGGPIDNNDRRGSKLERQRTNLTRKLQRTQSSRAEIVRNKIATQKRIEHAEAEIRFLEGQAVKTKVKPAQRRKNIDFNMASVSQLRGRFMVSLKEFGSIVGEFEKTQRGNHAPKRPHDTGDSDLKTLEKSQNVVSSTRRHADGREDRGGEPFKRQGSSLMPPPPSLHRAAPVLEGRRKSTRIVRRPSTIPDAAAALGKSAARLEDVLEKSRHRWERIMRRVLYRWNAALLEDRKRESLKELNQFRRDTSSLIKE